MHAWGGKLLPVSAIAHGMVYRAAMAVPVAYLAHAYVV